LPFHIFYFESRERQEHIFIHFCNIHNVIRSNEIRWVNRKWT